MSVMRPELIMKAFASTLAIKPRHAHPLVFHAREARRGLRGAGVTAQVRG